jgi:hypothetical protein
MTNLFPPMKLLLPTLLLFVLMMACKPTTKTETQPEPVQEAAAPAVNESVPFAGDWLNEKYYNLIKDKHSPRDAQEKVERVFIKIPGHMKDTTMMVYGFHEAGPELVVVKKNNAYGLWEVQGDSVAFAVHPLGPDTLQLGTERFVRIHSAHGSYGEALVLEEIMFKGKYKLKGGGDVEFDHSGKVKGLSNYKYYQVLTDYLDAGLDVDQIWLGTTKDSMDHFGFKMHDNNLKIFNLKCLEYNKVDKRCEQVNFGKIAYTLEKVN